MNFQDIVPVERSKSFLDMAFKKARERSRKTLKGEWLDKIRTKEMIKLDVIKAELVFRLDKIIQSFPSLDHLPHFYIELLKLTLDYKELKRALGSLDWAIDKIRFFQRNYIRKISKSRNHHKIKSFSREFYGRISSILRQIDKQLVFLEQSRHIMKKYPDIKEMPTVVIFGFPNVGKTTLLNKLTGSNAKVAAYSFTTLGINSGFMEDKHTKKSKISCVPETSSFREIQVLDVPGTLARLEKMNDIEKIAYLTVKELADVIVYVFDLSEMVSLKKQEQLYKKIKQEFKKKILIYLSKTDFIKEETIKEFQKKYQKTFDQKQLKKEIKKLI